MNLIIVYNYKLEEINMKITEGYMPVSYTHLDVYKRQILNHGKSLILNPQQNNLL